VSESSRGELDPARWRRVQEIFDAVADVHPAERAARLDAACESDPGLRGEVESLLAHDDSSHDTFEEIVAEAAQAVVTVNGGDERRPVPSIIGHYHIIEKLGEGGMGEVFLAEDTALGRRVALKLPAALPVGDDAARARLQREARAAATLNHPHVCVVHEVGESPDGHPFIAMEYLEGETLAARIARGRLPLDEVIALGREAASALDAAHARGVVHRDLKPSNIMLTPHGIKLLDFGLASVARDPLVARQPDVGAFMGTFRYMSPEQARGEVLDHRTDVFSLGVVLYEAATGRPPYDGDTPQAMRTATLEATPVAPSRIAGDLTTAFDRVIARALAKRPDERYQSARELGTDLERLGSPTPLPSRRTWIPWAVAAAALLAVTTYALVARLTPSRPAGPPQQQTMLVAAFSNTTQDPSFDGTLREALIVQLQQTPFVTIVPEAGVQETLRLMARAPDEPLTPLVAKEIALRRGIPVVIAGSIAPQSNGYAITLVATSGVSGGELARERVSARAE